MKHWKMIFGALCIAVGGMFYVWSLVRPPQPDVAQPDAGGEKPRLAASFYPLAFALQHIAGEGYDITTVTPGGVEPHDFEPSPQDIVRLQDVDVLFYNGAGLDSWVDRLMPALADKGVQTVNIVEALETSQYAILAAEEGEEAHEDEEDHGPEDPHVWLDPLAMEEIGRIVAETLSEKFADDAAQFEDNLELWVSDAQGLHRQFQLALTSCRLNEIIVSHDAFSYLGRRYGFEIIPIAGFSPQEQPSAKRLGELATLAKQKGITTIFFETLTSPKLSDALAREVGATTAVLDPIEGISAEDAHAGKNYMTIMVDNAMALSKAMQCSGL